jgi:hypothetical protein
VQTIVAVSSLALGVQPKPDVSVSPSTCKVAKPTGPVIVISLSFPVHEANCIVVPAVTPEKIQVKVVETLVALCVCHASMVTLPVVEMVATVVPPAPAQAVPPVPVFVHCPQTFPILRATKRVRARSEE